MNVVRRTLPLLAIPILAAFTPAPPADPAGNGPTMAVEDTMHTEIPPILISAPRVTLSEILDRVARGEARRDSLIQDQAFQATIRLVSHAADRNHEPQLESETVTQVYKRRPDDARSITLREWNRKPEKDHDADVDIRFRSDMSEEIVNFAFRPESRRDFRYRIVGRDFVGNTLVYRIAFEPRSALDPSKPSGIVWINTNEFVIVRQEVDFERSPVPLILKDIHRMVIERTREGGHWVLSRVLLRAETAIPLPRIGRSFDVAMRFDRYQINAGLPDSLFTRGPR